MKTELRAKPHSIFPDHYVVELWCDGKMIGLVAGADGPGIRIISPHTIGQTRPLDKSKHAVDAHLAARIGVHVVDIMISPK